MPQRCILVTGAAGGMQGRTGRQVARLLLDPNLPPGSSYPVVGAVPTLREIVATFSRVSAKDIHYENISDEAWRRAALENGVNHHAAEHLSQLWRFLRTRPAPGIADRLRITTETFERFGGGDPITLEEFLIKSRTDPTAAPPEA